MPDTEFPVELVIKSPAEQRVEARFGGRDIAEILRQLYHVEKLTQAQMARRMRVGRGTVIEWMQKHSIPTGYNKADGAAEAVQL